MARAEHQKQGIIGEVGPSMNTDSEDCPIRIGVSSCLLGEQVRHDGGHKRDPFLADVLAPYVEWVPVCPEMELGLGVPRETIQLRRWEHEIQLVTSESRKDLTEPMRAWASRKVKELSKERLSGFVLKSKSPSCGLKGVAVHDHVNRPARNGQGIFAQALTAQLRNLPVEEESSLDHPDRRENFIARAFAHRRLQSLFGRRWRIREAIDFHHDHKLLLTAHSTRGRRGLDRLVARIRELTRKDFRESYEALFMRTMGVQTTKAKHANVLRHVIGQLRRHLDQGSRSRLVELVDEYRHGVTPLALPLAAIHEYSELYAVEPLKSQVYLKPHRLELLLRRRV